MRGDGQCSISNLTVSQCVVQLLLDVRGRTGQILKCGFEYIHSKYEYSEE